MGLDPSTSGKKIARSRLGDRCEGSGAAFGDDVSAMYAGAGTDVDDMVCTSDGRFVVFDDDQTVAEIAQALETLEKTFVVTGMKANGRLVEDIEDPDQLSADLCRKPNALCLAARERRCRSIETEITESDFFEETEPFPELQLDSLGDARQIGRKRQRVEERDHIRDRERRQFGK